LKIAIVAFFNLAKRRSKLVAARKTANLVAVLASHPCDGAARRLYQRAAKPLCLTRRTVVNFGGTDIP